MTWKTFSPRDKKVETGLKFKHGMEAGKEIALLILPMSDPRFARGNDHQIQHPAGLRSQGRRRELRMVRRGGMNFWVND